MRKKKIKANYATQRIMIISKTTPILIQHSGMFPP